MLAGIVFASLILKRIGVQLMDVRTITEFLSIGTGFAKWRIGKSFQSWQRVNHEHRIQNCGRPELLSLTCKCPFTGFFSLFYGKSRWRYQMRLYVGNLSWDTNEDGLAKHFGQYGSVQSVKIITDQASGRSRGFGFIDMENAEEAMKNLNGKELDGRPLVVNEARERSNNRKGGNDKRDNRYNNRK